MPDSTTIYQGLTASVRFTGYLEDEDGVQTADDFTGYTFESHVRSKSGNTLIADLSEYFELVDGELDQVQMTIPPADTDALTLGSYSWDVVAISAGGVRTFLVPTEPLYILRPETQL